MGAVEHLKTLCCLGIPAESALIAVVPLLHEIIPHGWTRIWLWEPDATIGHCYAENPEAGALYRQRMWPFNDDPASILGLYRSAYYAMGIGWTLPRQGRDWLEGAWYREIEAPLDACWILDSMIGENGKSYAAVNMLRPRAARPFTADDVRCLDRLRPWLAHALRRRSADAACVPTTEEAEVAGAVVRKGEVILSADGKLMFQTSGIETLLQILDGEPNSYKRSLPSRDLLPAPIMTLVRQISDAASGVSNLPPRLQVPSAYGVLTLEAKWLVPVGTIPADVARDPKSCHIGVTIELREFAIAHAARVLRESGATPAQMKVGVQLALGKSRPAIAREFGLQLSSVTDLTKKLYQRLDVHNTAELGVKLWLNHRGAADTGRRGILPRVGYQQ